MTADLNQEHETTADEELRESAHGESASRFLGAAMIAALPILLLFPPYMFEHPYALDEAWVAVAVRSPLSELFLVTGSTPIGWTILMILTPGQGEQHQRLLPLAFAVGTVAVAYLLARDLRWPTPSAGVMAASFTAVVVAAVPIAMLRQDLKQYTADAFFTFLIVWLVVRIEASWSRRRLGTLVIVCVIGALISYASMFVAAAAMLSLVVVAAVGGDRRRFSQTLAAAATTATSFLIVAWILILPHVTDSLSGYWSDFYLTTEDGIWALAQEGWKRLSALAPLLGLRWGLLVIVLGIAGIAALARRGRPAAAWILPILVVEMTALGVLDRYPFLNRRTSHFLLMLTVAIAAIGVASLASDLSHRWSMLGPAVLVPALAFFFYMASPFVGSQSLPNEDVRSQTEYVEANLSIGDTVLVNASGMYGFAYYWNQDDPIFVPSDRVATGFVVDFTQDYLLIAKGRNQDQVDAALASALTSASEDASNGRVWLIRSHVSDDERAAWDSAFARAGVDVVLVTDGPEPLGLITIPDVDDS
jgi:hypothetical protein